MSKEKELLFKDFPPTDTQTWIDKITTDLKGADFQRKMVWRTTEGFNVNPFYRSEDIENYPWIENLPGEFPYVRSTKISNRWYTRQNIKVEDFKEANKKAIRLLTKGVTSFGFSLICENITLDNLQTLLKGIPLESTEINFKATKFSTIDLARLVVEFFKTQKADLSKCFGSIEFDPFEIILIDGIDTPHWADQCAELIKITKPLPKFRPITISGSLLCNAGSYIYQELGFSLAWGNEVLNALTGKGISIVDAANKIKFIFGIGTNYFMEIAKFRAARWLWALIVSAYDKKDSNPDSYLKEASKIYIHAETSAFNQTLYDAYVNLLRSQTESMSASIAGVDSLTVRPFNDSFEEHTVISERIALNQQLLLKEECHFDKIVDPSAGSYYIENLTYFIAQQAWTLFLKTDKEGFYMALKAGTVQETISAASAARFNAMGARKEILLGTNQFPNFTEKKLDKANSKEKCIEDKNKSIGSLQKLSFKRLAEPFEELRLATERAGKTPKVFMLTIGNLAMRLARSQFSCNFFACAGYQVIDNLGFETVEKGVLAARKVNADIIVICSGDDEYETLAPQAYELVKGKEIFVVAGAPPSMDALKENGIEFFINVRSNVLETLKHFHSLLNIK